MQNLILSIEALINKIKKADFHGLYVNEVFKVEQELANIRKNSPKKIDENLENKISEYLSKPYLNN